MFSKVAGGLISVALVLLMATAAPRAQAQESADSVRQAVEKAQETFDQERTTVRDAVLKSLERAAETARKAGNKSQLEKIEAETAAFESATTWPTLINTREQQRKMRKARTTAEAAFQKALKNYVRLNLRSEADALEQELTAFQLREKIFRGKHFAVFRQLLPWKQAKAFCEKQGGHLAMVRTEEESKYVIALLESEHIRVTFLGATDEQREGRWLWIDGTPMTYANWDTAKGQPNNNNGRGKVEHYLVLRGDMGGVWWDFPGDGEGTDGFLCQWD